LKEEKQVYSQQLENALLALRLKEAKKSKLYKSLQRKYQIPKPYCQYSDILLGLVYSSEIVPLLNAKSPREQFRPEYEASCMSMLFELNEPSVYCLYPELLEAIKLTDLPLSFPSLEQSVPLGILLLPEVLTEPSEKSGVDHLIFSHYSKLDALPTRKNMDYSLILSEEESWRSITWFSITKDRMTSYCEEVRLDNHGNIISKSENQFISGLTSILVQSLYFIQEETFISFNLPNTSNSKKGNTKQPKTQVVRHPKHLGQNFAFKTKQIDQLEQNFSVNYPTSRHSPIPHIRRGHRKIVRHGQGRQLTKTVWIPPNWVGSRYEQ
jgi:hypothetical protein